MAFLGFKLNGEFVTNHTRDLVLSGDWREALYFLTDSFEGMTYDIALNILKGNLKIIGENNDLETVQEDDEIIKDYNETLNSIYLAGRLNFNGKRLKSYGYVYYATDDDAQLITNSIRSGNSRYSDWPRELGHLYMANKSLDECFMVHLPNTEQHIYVPTLFELDSDNIDPPPWMKIPKSPQESIDLLDGIISNIGYIPKENKGFSVEWSLKQAATKEQHKRTPPSNLVERMEKRIEEKKSKTSDWRDSYQSDLIKYFIEEKFNMSVSEYNAKLKSEILSACKERNILMDSFKFQYEEDGSTKYKTITYPRDVILNYALSRSNSKHLMTDMKPISPSGIKMENDNSYHTDAWVACGFDLDYSIYSSEHPNFLAFNAIVSKVLDDVLNYKVTILNSANKEFLLGIVRTPETFHQRKENEKTILLVPHAGEEFATMFYQSSALICETGGKLAHLVIVGREMGIPIVREDNATKKYKNGMDLNIDFNDGKISIHPKDYLADIDDYAINNSYKFKL